MIENRIERPLQEASSVTWIMGTHLTDTDAFIENATSWLQGKLSLSRFDHSLGVYEAAVELAQAFELSAVLSAHAVTQIKIAALLHDCAKLMHPTSLLAYAKDYGVSLSEDDFKSPQVLHAHVGATVVKNTFEIDDNEILNAIRYHTTGRPGMSWVEKVVYVADKIEKRTRTGQWVERVRAELMPPDLTTLDRAMLTLSEETLNFLLAERQVIHPLTVACRNELLMSLKKLDVLREPSLHVSSQTVLP